MSKLRKVAGSTLADADGHGPLHAPALGSEAKGAKGPSRRTPLLALACLALAAALGLGRIERLKQLLITGQIEATRKAAEAMDTLTDYDLAGTLAFPGLGQLESMHQAAPGNEDALFLLAKGWTGATFAFLEDRMEEAEDAEGTGSARFRAAQARARAGYDRAIQYGLELLERRSPGFVAARRNDATVRAWLSGFEDATRDAPALFWTGYAWIARTDVAKDDPALVADLFVGVAMVERAVALDERYQDGEGHIVLGAYHARPMGELDCTPLVPDCAKAHFERALELNGGSLLLTKLNYAVKYACMKGDRGRYVQLLEEVLAAGDGPPWQRLENAIARRRATRYLGKERMKACAFAEGQ